MVAGGRAPKELLWTVGLDETEGFALADLVDERRGHGPANSTGDGWCMAASRLDVRSRKYRVSASLGYPILSSNTYLCTKHCKEHLVLTYLCR